MGIDLKERSDAIDIEKQQVEDKIKALLLKYNCDKIEQVQKKNRYRLLVLSKYLDEIENHRLRLVCRNSLDIKIKKLLSLELYEDAEAVKLAIAFFDRNNF